MFNNLLTKTFIFLFLLIISSTSVWSTEEMKHKKHKHGHGHGEHDEVNMPGLHQLLVSNLSLLKNLIPDTPFNFLRMTDPNSLSLKI